MIRTYFNAHIIYSSIQKKRIMAKSGSFQITKFDPTLLISQIIAQQSLLYFSLTALLWIGLTFLDINLSLSSVFDYRVSGGAFKDFWCYNLFILANQCLECGRILNNFVFHVEFFTWSIISVVFCDEKENVLRLLVRQWFNFIVIPPFNHFHFSCTFHVVHFVVCFFYEGFPSLSYWLLNVTCLVIMCVTSEFLCMREEMKEIPLYQPLSTKSDLWS